MRKQKARFLDDINKIHPLDNKKAIKIFADSHNKGELVNNPRYFGYPGDFRTYGIIFPYSFIARIRGRYDLNSFNIFPSTIEEAIIQSTFVHEFTHLSHFSATPYGVYYCINLIINLSNLQQAIVNSIGRTGEKIKIPLIRFINDKPRKDILQKWFDEFKENHLVFTSIEDLTINHDNENIYPEDLSELCALYNQLSYLNCHFVGDDDNKNLDKIFDYMKSNNIPIQIHNRNVAQLWSDSCVRGYFYLIPILVDLAFYGTYKELKQPNAIINNYNILCNIAAEKFNNFGKNTNDLMAGIYEIEKELLLLSRNLNSKSYLGYYQEVESNLYNYIQSWNRELKFIPSSYFTTMIKGLNTKMAALGDFLFPYFSFPVIQSRHTFTGLLSPDNFPYPEPYRKRSEATMFIYNHPPWELIEEAWQLIKWTEVASTGYQLIFENKLMCPERSVMALCGFEPLPKDNISKHKCGFKYKLRYNWQLDASQIQFYDSI